MIFRVPKIETDRLILRAWKKTDMYDLFDYAQNPNVGKNAGWRPHQNVQESKRIIAEYYRRSTSWAIQEKESGRVIGNISFTDDVYRPGVCGKEMGYSLSEDYWGHGYMTEAAKALMEYGFHELALPIIAIKTSPENNRSQRVIEKCGFKYEGMLRLGARAWNGTVCDVNCYSITRNEYYETEE